MTAVFLLVTFIVQEYFWNKSTLQLRRPLHDYGNWAIIDLVDIVNVVNNHNSNNDTTNGNRNYLYRHFTETFAKNGIHVILILKDTPNADEKLWIEKVMSQTNIEIKTLTRNELNNNNDHQDNKDTKEETETITSSIGVDLLLGQFMTVGFLITTASRNSNGTGRERFNHSCMIDSVQRLFEFRTTGAFILFESSLSSKGKDNNGGGVSCPRPLLQQERMKKYGIDVLMIPKDKNMENLNDTNLVNLSLEQLGQTRVLSFRHFLLPRILQFYQ